MIDLDLQAAAEQVLLRSGDWVPARRLAKEIGIPPRRLRAQGKRPGLCDLFAVSSNRGYKHVRFCATTEYLRQKHSLLRHSVTQIRKVRAWSRARHRPTAKPDPLKPASELHTGQLLMSV